MQTRLTPEVLRHMESEVGEGPTWDPQTDTLVWVDIHGCTVYRDDLSGPTTSIGVGAHVGAALPSERAGELLLLLRSGFHLLDGQGEVSAIATPLGDSPGLRFNDGKVDPRGRAYGGTMPYQLGPVDAQLYRLEPDAAATVVVDSMTLANGLEWTRDQRTMYLTDSGRGTVWRYRYAPDDGRLSEPESFVEVAADEGMPDGLTVDDDGGVWVAHHGAGFVRRYTPDGRPDVTVTLPVSQPTGVCFAGPDLSTLVVTSARFGLDTAALAHESLAGSLFAIQTANTGAAATPWHEVGGQKG